MKRAAAVAVSDSSLDAPRRSERLKSLNNNNHDASVVSIGSQDSEKAKPPASIVRNFPQDALEQINSMLPFLTEHVQEFGNESDDDSTTSSTELQYHDYIKVKEGIFQILKFALSEKSFLGKNEETRHVQATSMNTLIHHSNESNNNTTNVLGIVGMFLQVVCCENSFAPKSLYLFQQTREELLEEMDCTRAVQDEATIHTRFTQFLIQRGEELVDLHHSKKSLVRFLFRDDTVKLERMSHLIQVQERIVEVWIQLLCDETWNASSLVRMEQLENVHASFTFCKNMLVSTEFTTLNVKMMLWKLALYCHYAMKWPSESYTAEERMELERLEKLTRG
jgi:hypothetical protein